MRKLILALTLGAILIPNQGFTLGLGEIEVNSSLNQKLTARIDLLSAMPEDAESLIVKLASREEFIRAGLDRPLVLSSLKFKTSVEDGHVYINVLSPKPVREPFLNFLVEVDWPKGHLIREYTILLDPPVFMTRSQETAPVSVRPAMQEVAGSPPVTVQSSVVEAPVAVEPVVAEEVIVQEQEPVQQQASYTAPSYVASTDHRIQAGDTAWSLANSMRPDSSVSTEQMMMAMLRANPESFINENVNGLKRGYILRTPDAEDINATSHEEAKAAVSQQNALWREYQQSLASDRPASAIDENEDETGYSSAAEVSDDSRLSIVSAGGGSSASGDMKDPSEMTASELREQLSLARERVETERVEKENLQQQVGSLTTQVDKMKGLLTIEDDAMAEIQSVGDTSKDDSGEEILADDAVAELGDEEQALDALAELTGDLGSEEGEAEAAAEVVTDAEDVFVDEATEQAVDTEAVIEDEVMDEWTPEVAQQQETDLIDTLLNNRMIVGGLLVLVLVVGAIVYLVMMKRRRDSASSESDSSSGVDIFDTKEDVALEDITDMIDDESVDDLVTDEEVKASMAEAEAEEEFDAEATMILPSESDTVVTQAEDLQDEEEPEEQDDVLAEADVYLAYGIYQQSEELLENAIKENPDKDSYRVKLAETYFAGKNSDGLKKLGVEMKARLGNEDSAAWKKVVALGKELCPDADVFQQADLDTELDVNDLMPKSPEPMDFDLAEDTDEAASDDLDFALDDLGGDELELPSMDADETAVISPDDAAESLDELEFDLSETDAIEEVPPIEEEEFSLDIEASELDLEESSDADLNMDIDMSLDSESAPEESSDDDNALDFDLDMSMDDESASEAEGEPALDFSMDESASEAEDEPALDFSMDDSALEAEDEPALDLSVDDSALEAEEESALDLSMDDITSTEETLDADVNLSMDDDLDDVDLSEPVDAEEIDTKLDLAKAYLDMGDHEGARDILDEVLAGGNADQKKEAEELMAQAG